MATQKVAPQLDSMAAILAAIQEGERFLICSHARPDGDALGSMLAMGMLLDALGKHADLVAADRVPPIYRDLAGADRIRQTRNVRGIYDAVILLECDSLARTELRGLEDYFHINIDHHASGKMYGHLNWIDRDASATGELVYRLALAAGVTVTPQMASCLYTALLTDTGGFRYGPTQASTFALAERLVAAGANPVRIAQEVYFANPESKLHLLGAALANLHREERIAWLWVTQQDMHRLNATEEDCEGIANYALSIHGVEAAVFLRELPTESTGPRFRLSLRGKGRVDVAAIAEQFGGGGHENAAGCTLDGPLESALNQILSVLRQETA